MLSMRKMSESMRRISLATDLVPMIETRESRRTIIEEIPNSLDIIREADIDPMISPFTVMTIDN